MGLFNMFYLLIFIVFAIFVYLKVTEKERIDNFNYDYFVGLC